MSDRNLSRAKLQAVLFDMDGTLLAPEEHSSLLEFKARWGIPSEQLVIPNLSKLPVDAYQGFIDLESSLAQHGVLRVGVTDLLETLSVKGVKTALVTNNSVDSAKTMIGKFDLQFDALLTRDTAPMKPAPDMLLQALELLGVDVSNAVMIGDTAADSGAALAAKVAHCYLLSEPWNASLEGESVTRVTDFAALKSKLLERL